MMLSQERRDKQTGWTPPVAPGRGRFKYIRATYARVSICCFPFESIVCCLHGSKVVCALEVRGGTQPRVTTEVPMVSISSFT